MRKALHVSDADGSPSRWLLLLAQLPSTPSSARVALWRRMRAAGATATVNGAWMLPDTAPHAELLDQAREGIRKQGGTAFVLSVQAPSPDANAEFIERFQADRSREYDEFAERCTALLDEIRREARAGKYTFAEMEESEQDLDKLARWLVKIRARDFFPDERAHQAAHLLTCCRDALDGFSQAVYAAEEVQDPADGVALSVNNGHVRGHLFATLVALFAALVAPQEWPHYVKHISQAAGQRVFLIGPLTAFLLPF